LDTEGNGIAITQWNDAGSYLCNYVFFRAMHRFRHRVPSLGFMHLPPYRTPEHPHGADQDDLMSATRALIHELAVWIGKTSDVACGGSAPERRL
jgi:pyrrolidone-carboxylate peptidase